MTAETGGAEKIDVRTPNVPGYARKVDAAKYRMMRAELLRVIPSRGAGITAAAMVAAVRPRVPKALFGHEAVQWWVKCVQLDLEARDVLVRDSSAKPLRWRRRPAGRATKRRPAGSATRRAPGGI